MIIRRRLLLNVDVQPFAHAMPHLQQTLLALLSPRHLLCKSWPLGQDLMDSRLATAVSEHVRQLNTRFHLGMDRPPGSIPATAVSLAATSRQADGRQLTHH